MTDLNCQAVVAMCQITAPYMPRGSQIINIASVAAFQPIPYIDVYGATKAFVLSFSRALNRELRRQGVFVYSVEQVEGSTKLHHLQLDPSRRYALVFGNEVKGVHQEVVDASDGCIEIPQFGTKHSLNVSVTAGIVVWEVAKQMIL